MGMTPKFWMFVMFAWIVGTLCCLIIDGTYFGAAQTSIFHDLTAFKTYNLGGLIELPWINLDFFTQAVPKIMTWNYSFLQGGYSLLKIFLYVLTAGAVLGFMLIFIPAIQSALPRR